MKVVIPTAGIGSRLGKLTEYYNKCMIPIGEKPILSYIMDWYPDGTKFVIAAGYKKEYIKQYLRLAYPEKNIVVVDVDKFIGKGSGLGYSLSKCEEHLQEPFMFHTNDSVILDDFHSFPDENTMFISKKNVNPRTYRTVAKDKRGKVTKVFDKTTDRLDESIYNYVGISFIKRYKDFWKVMNAVTADIGETYYFQHATKDLNTFELKQWYDIGNIEQLQIAKKEITEFKNLEKPKESLYFIEDRVLKFSVDDNFISERIKRAEYLGETVPNVVESSKNFYVYNYVSGEVLSQIINISNVLEDLLNWSIKNLWIPRKLGQKEKHAFRDMCFNFYYEKTLNRINDFYKIYDTTDTREIINGTSFGKLSSMLEGLDWHSITNGVPTGFHGDFCFDNIIKIKNGYKLIDWRQNFSGNLEYGDIYYDFAKMLHGFIINHPIINNDLYEIARHDNKIEFDFHRKNNLVECESILQRFVEDHGYDWKKVLVLTYIIFLNMSPLHHYPFSHLLYYLGKSGLGGLIK